MPATTVIGGDVPVPKDASGPPVDPAAVKARVAAADEAMKVPIRHAILVAVQREYAAVLSVFGKEKRYPNLDQPDSPVRYVEIVKRSGETVLLLMAGVTDAGIAQAASLASQIKWANRHIGRIIMVGIAGGQPSLTDAERDVRLGDIVVGSSVVQYDHLKVTDEGEELRGDKLPKPDSTLLQAVERLRALQELNGGEFDELPWKAHMNAGARVYTSSGRPPLEKDSNHGRRQHADDTLSSIVRKDGEPFVHVGVIGSGSLLIKSEKTREMLRKRTGCIAYEMEGAGIAIASSINGFGYLIVRGICDYADKRKNDDWQRYAALAADGFARAVVEEL